MDLKEKQMMVVREPIADPAPLGLASFALTTFVLSAHTAGWAPNGIWVGLAFFYGGLGQFIAGMWEFKNRNAFGATAFSTYGSFWLGLGLFNVLYIADLVPVSHESHYYSQAVGWYLAGFFIFNSYMTVVATMLSKATLVVFSFLEVTLFFLMIGHLKNQEGGWTKAGGYFGVFTAFAAWYASAAAVFNATAKRAVIPVGSPLVVFYQEPNESKESIEV